MFDNYQLSGKSNDIVYNLLNALQHPEEEILGESKFQPGDKEEKEGCHFYNCFNIYRCIDHSGGQQKIHVHIPEPKKILIGSTELFPVTWEFVEIIEAVASSEFYTSDPNKACVFIPAIDVLNEFQIHDNTIIHR